MSSTDVISVIEVAIMDKLKLDIADTQYRVERFPEKPNEYRLNHSKGAVLVAYPGSRYSDDSNALNLREMQWVITLLVRGVQTHHAAYPLIETVMLALDGWSPPGCRKLRIQYDRFITENGGVWQYDLLFHVDRNHIAGHACLPNTNS